MSKFKLLIAIFATLAASLIGNLAAARSATHDEQHFKDTTDRLNSASESAESEAPKSRAVFEHFAQWYNWANWSNWGNWPNY